MAKKAKLKRIAEVATFDNVLEHQDLDDAPKPAGSWNRNIFKNDKPIVLELACGKGEYTVALAQKYPDKNFIGVDIKGPRIWKGAKKARENSIDNVRFLRCYIDHLATFFEEKEVSEIWITFPDPFLKIRDRKKRLTSPKFLKIYRQVAANECKVNLKTDSDSLYRYTKKVIAMEELEIADDVSDVYSEKPEDDLLTIQTFFEKKHLEAGRTIKFLSFYLND